MKVLGIIGSPARGGVGGIVVELLAGATEAGHTCRSICLPELSLRDCTHCLACREKGHCVLRDSIEQVEEAVLWSDVIVWATPVHWSNVSADMARVLERLSGFLVVHREYGLPLPSHARGKKAVLVVASDSPWPFNWLLDGSRAAVGRMKETCRISGQKVIKTFLASRAFRSRYVSSRSLRKARHFGRRLKDHDRAANRKPRTHSGTLNKDSMPAGK